MEITVVLTVQELEEDGHVPTPGEVAATVGDVLKYSHKGGGFGWRITRVELPPRPAGDPR